MVRERMTIGKNMLGPYDVIRGRYADIYSLQIVTTGRTKRLRINNGIAEFQLYDDYTIDDAIKHFLSKEFQDEYDDWVNSLNCD